MMTTVLTMTSNSNTTNSARMDSISLTDAEKQLLDTIPVSDREVRLEQLLQQLNEHRVDSNTNDVMPPFAASIALEIAGLCLDLDQKDRAYEHAKATIETFIAHQQFENAALACQYIYLCDKPDAIAAIGQAAWLSVTYPVDPHLTANVLDHIIDETPDDSDGAAVAAATAHYVVDMRCKANEHTELKLFTGAMLARVARRHSNVEAQQKFELWVKILELDDPGKFLVRLRNVIDVMVQDDWWFDREQLSKELPDD